MKANLSIKKLLSLAVFSAGMVASSAHAGLYALDEFVGKANIGSSDAEEAAYLNTLTGSTGYTKVAASSVTLAQNPGTLDQWFIDVDPATPGYFMLKFGTGGTGLTEDHYIFKNLVDLTKLVFSDSQVDYLTGGCTVFNGCGTGRLSHYAITSGDGSTDPGGDPLPEPATLGLFGLGLMGLALGRRKLGK
jgi:hypothetical protein